MCIFIYRTYHHSSHGGLQFLLKGNQINIIQVFNLQPSFYKSDQIKSNQIKCWFLVRGENRSTRGKTSHSRVENQQTQSTYNAECGNRTRATLVEGKCSHHWANPYHREIHVFLPFYMQFVLLGAVINIMFGNDLFSSYSERKPKTWMVLFLINTNMKVLIA